MTIRRLGVGHFGKLKGIEINLKDGLNIIYGENESGKSTLQAFIKALFYGMNSQKKDIRENNRLHYIPWGENKAHGELHFSDRYHNSYVIKRSFGQKKRDDEVEVLNIITGEIAPHIEGEKPGEEIFGLGEGAFERTAWIKQLGCEVVQDKDDELIKRLTNLQESGQENVSYHKAMDGLSEARKSLTNQRKTGKLDKLKQDSINLLQELRTSSIKYDKGIEDEIQYKLMKKEKEELEEELKKLDLTKKERREYDTWIDLRIRVDETQAKAGLLRERLLELERLMSDFQGYEGLSENIVFQLIDTLNEKKNLEEKLAEYSVLFTEWEESEKTLENFSGNHREILKFEQVNKTMEMEITKLENTLKELQYRLNQSGKLDNLNIRRDLLVDKNRTLSILFVLGIVSILGGVAAGYFMNRLLYSFIVMGILQLIWVSNGKKSNLNKIKKLEEEINALESKTTIEEIEGIKEKLHSIYRKFGVLNYEDFLGGIGKYQDARSDLEALRFKTKEKSVVLEKMEIQQFKAKLFHANEYIQNIFGLYRCSSLAEINSKLKQYQEFVHEKQNLEKELSKINEGLDTEKKALEVMEAELKNKLGSFMEKAPLSEEELDKLSRELHEKRIDLEKMIKDMEHSIETRFQHHRPPTEVQEELYTIKEKVAHYEKTIKSMDLTMEVLQEAFQEMQRSFGPRLNRMAADVFGKITNGKYDELKISEDYEIKVVDPMENTIRHMDYFSNGTWDQIYFSLRMGLINLVFEGDNAIPILLDDAFLQYDDNRLERTLEYLYECSKERQVILFTCQKRELEILKHYKDINCITL